jgi:hypothetical protein
MIPKLISEDIFNSFLTQFSLELRNQHSNYEGLSNRDQELIRDTIELWEQEKNKSCSPSVRMYEMSCGQVFIKE